MFSIYIIVGIDGKTQILLNFHTVLSSQTGERLLVGIRIIDAISLYFLIAFFYQFFISFTFYGLTFSNSLNTKLSGVAYYNFCHISPPKHYLIYSFRLNKGIHIIVAIFKKKICQNRTDPFCLVLLIKQEYPQMLPHLRVFGFPVFNLAVFGLMLHTEDSFKKYLLGTTNI